MKHIIVLTLAVMAAFSISVWSDEFIPQIIKIYDESEIEKLEDAGVNILRRRGDLLLCFIPKDSISDEISPILPNGSVKGARAVRRSEIRKKKYGGGLNVPTLDIAVGYFDAGDILSGKGFEQPYTGKDVVVGLCDIGFDPLHPTFLDKEGKSRVKRLTQYKESEGICIQLEGDEEYAQWLTDNADEYHATHVAGILAGNGAGTPYVGIARDADIVASTSTLSDVGILAGVEDIIDYAKEVGKPCVINLSVGNYVGAHDGSSLASQYLDLCAEDAIIVLSAGNEGNQLNTLYYRFTEAQPSVGFLLGNRAWDQIHIYGETDVWSGTDQPLTIQLSIYDDELKQTVYSYPEFTLSGDESESLEWNPESPHFPGLAITGALAVTGGVDKENGRYRVILEYDFDSERLVAGKPWARYVIRVDVTGQPGNDIDVFADGIYTRLMGLPGSPSSPTSAMSISDIACGKNVISVGMYGNRSTWPMTLYDENNQPIIKYEDTGYHGGETVVHSSYGTLRDGRSLPLTTAPGAPLMSAFSRPYKQAHPEEPHLMLESPWIYEGGTSMSSPLVAGFIATWLEAIPSITVWDVQEMIAESNRHDIDQPDNPRNINGWFDPLSALREAIDNGAVGEIEDDRKPLMPGDRIELFSITGIRLYAGRYVDIPSLHAGPCIMKTQSGSRQFIMKF